ncbi:MGDG synthase family glycosyltransferase [Alicyclobacillus sp. ALC3]|uniref:MGDG synthase family glycosyltransferase n=1 Tax=Alicyclobacillus sp. ALC3 TaxID=2796143 RepID=UPI0023799488|nr:glycosyltransferase [Alicyclobacillus sp. ALC3]WDL96839.1 galactosyldiacylglycerol synthase [Alicyclobacillus sp. ALC3]
MRVLLLTASYGDGHHQVASALADAFSLFGADVREFDCIRSGGRADGQSRVFGEWVYESLTRFAPWLYGISYNWTRNLSERHPLWWLLSLPLRGRLTHLLRDFRPDVVLQLFPERLLSDMKSADLPPFIGVVVTDYSVHTRWYHRRVTTYFLPALDFLDLSRRFVLPHSRCVATGIPLRRQFWTSERANDDVQRHQVETVDTSRPYVLVAAGGRGLFPDLQQTLLQLCARLPDHDVYVMCGKNQRMLETIQRVSEDMPRVVGLPFVSEVALLYKYASFAVVKAGGLTVSECLAMSCPMLLYRPQPGQEYDNAKYVESIGAGRLVHASRELADVLSAFADPAVRTEMRAACRESAHPNAANDVVHVVMNTVNNASSQVTEFTKFR